MFRPSFWPLLFLLAAPLRAQNGPDAAGDVRVSVVMNADGSRTTYESHPAEHRTVAVTTNADGKLREKIRYELDEVGRFARSEVLGAKDEFRFRASYTYDGNGRLSEEARTDEKGNPLGKMVFQYDGAGHQTGYIVYDGNGKLLGQTTAAATPKKDSRKK